VKYKISLIYISLLFLTLVCPFAIHATYQWQVLSSVTLIRDTGKPVTKTLLFSALGGTATCQLTSDKVSSAVIIFNGESLWSPFDFNQGVTQLEKLIDLFEGTNTLEVTLKGKPGGKITIEILQEVAIITPEISIVQTANALRTGDIDLVMEGFTKSELTQSAIQSLDADRRNKLALWIENSELIKESDGRRVYRYTWPDEAGEKYSDFTMAIDYDGGWIITNW